MVYSEIIIGQKAEVVHTISNHDISKFVELTGDDNRLHIDAEFAKQTSFKKQVAHGMLGASFISTVIGTKLPGDGALWYSQNLEFLLPVRIGDTIRVVAEVIKKYDRDQIIELSTNIFNQNKKKVTTGTAKVKIVALQDEHEDSNQEISKKKVALVLGASGGIGLETTKLLLEKGFMVLAHYNSNKEALSHLLNAKNTQNLKLISFDYKKHGFEQELVSYLNRYQLSIDTFINALAAPIPTIDLDELEWSDFESQLYINIQIPLTLIQGLLKNDLLNQEASIVFISSQVVEFPNAKWVHYTTSKAALTGFTKSMALELATKKIRVNQVSPSLTPTNLVSEIPEKVRLVTAAKTPLRRLAQPNDVAQAITFLADSSQSGFITGETIRVNGGQIMW